MGIWDIEKVRLTELSPELSEELVYKLASAELKNSNENTSEVYFSGHTNAPDGGEDIRVSCTNSEFKPGYIKSAETVFQVKNTTLTKSKIVNEISNNGTLRPFFKELSENSGSYIIVNFFDLSPTKIKSFELEMKKIVESQLGKVPIDVFLYDLSKIHQWLSEYPSVLLWVRRKLGLPIDGIETPETWWDDWASSLKPKITKRLVESRRFDESRQLLNYISNGSKVISVKGENTQEAIAFVIATLSLAKDRTFINRTWIIRKNAILQPGYEISNPILICDYSGKDVNFIDRDKITIIRVDRSHTHNIEYAPELTGPINITSPITLSHVPKDIFIEELVEMGKSKEEATQISQITGNSVPILRRLLSEDTNIRKPIWARDQELVKNLLPFALVGAWDLSAFSIDSEIIQFLGDIDEVDVKESSKKFCNVEDCPVVEYGEVFYIISLRETLFAIGETITESSKKCFDRFFELVPNLLSRTNPKLKMTKNEKLLRILEGQDKKHSNLIKERICDTLCILAVHGEKLLGNRIDIDFKKHIDETVNKIINNYDDNRWYNCRRYLKELAEASPNVFLETLKNDLENSSPAIDKIMGTESGLVYDECLRSELLWALESLGWFKKYFRNVVKILLKLENFKINDKWANTPKSTIESLFRFWLPSTTVGIEDRFRVLEELIGEHRPNIIDLLLKLLPKHSSFGSRTSRPIWRNLDENVPEITYEDIIIAEKRASSLLLSMGPYSFAELSKILKQSDELFLDELKKLVTELKEWRIKALETEIEFLWELVREKRALLVRQNLSKMVDRHKSVEKIVNLQSMEKILEPTAEVAKNTWLFKNKIIDWPLLVDEKCEVAPDWKIREELLEDKQKFVIEKIFNKSGITGILEFATKVELSNVVANLAIPNNTPMNELINWISQVVCTESSFAMDNFLRSILKKISVKEFKNVVSALFENELEGSELKKSRIAKCLTNDKDGWEKVKILGKVYEVQYWKESNFLLSSNYSTQDIEYVVTNLLKVNRPKSAYNAVYHSPDILNGKFWNRILTSLLDGHDQEKIYIDFHNLDDILGILDEDSDVSDYKIEKIEFELAPTYFLHYESYPEKRIPVLHRKICRDPGYLIKLLCFIYKKDKGEFSDKNSLHAYYILSSWNKLPGQDSSNLLDEKIFNDWIKKAYVEAKKSKIEVKLDTELGELFAKYTKKIPEERCLPNAILKILEKQEKIKMRESFCTGIYNSLGVTVREVYDGGEIEKNIASTYEKLAKKYEVTYPNVSEMFLKIEKSYLDDSKSMDNRAIVRERFSS